MRDLDELRQLTAGRLLAIWRESRYAAEDPMERALLCNAQILAEGCFCQGRAAFENREAVLETLTTQEMETLLRQMAADTVPVNGEKNAAFDQKRFEQLREV